MSFLSGLGSVLGGLSGFFGKKSAPTPAANLMSQAKGARQAAEQYGFNPLTMLQFGQTGASTAGGGGAPPLASLQILTEGLDKVSDELSGDADRRRAAQELELELLKREVESKAVGSASLGPRGVAAVQGNTRAASTRGFGLGAAAATPSSLSWDSIFKAKPVTAPLPQEDVVTPRSSDYIMVRSSIDGKDYPVPAVNGEMMDIGQAIVAGVSIMPQMALDYYMEKVGNPFADKLQNDVDYWKTPNDESWIDPDQPFHDPANPRPYKR